MDIFVGNFHINEDCSNFSKTQPGIRRSIKDCLFMATKPNFLSSVTPLFYGQLTASLVSPALDIAKTKVDLSCLYCNFHK